MERTLRVEDEGRLEGEEPSFRMCEFAGCDREGVHRAPRAPCDLRSYRWFCLDHVRDYNRSWNFFSGWSRSDLEKFLRDDLTGHRPTWPIGGNSCGRGASDDLEAMFRAFQREWLSENDGPRQRNGGGNGANASTAYQEALALLDLTPPFNLGELKRRYKFLVKRHHPDANGGSRDSEELLKRINRAYNYLRKACA